MKRFDPNYQAALDFLPADGRGLRYVSVEVSDPDSWPFVDHRPLTRADDVPAELADDLRARQRAQAAEALGAAVDGDDLRGYADPLMSGVVHAVNAVHGMLDRMGIPDGEVVAGADLGARRGRRRLGLAPRRAGAVAPGPGARARRGLVPRALHAPFRRRGRRARVPGALPEPPADPARGAPLRRPPARDAARRGRLRGGVRPRARGVLGGGNRSRPRPKHGRGGRPRLPPPAPPSPPRPSTQQRGQTPLLRARGRARAPARREAGSRRGRSPGSRA